MRKRLKPIRLATKDGGVLKVVGQGKDACLNFHAGNAPYALIDNSLTVRNFLRDALERMRIPIHCMTCSDDRKVLQGTGDPEHPLKAVPCPDCTKRSQKHGK